MPNQTSSKYAILIGINDYHESLGSLNCCVQDVQLMEQTLVEYCGFPKNNVLLLTDDEPEERKPTYGNIHSWLASWLTFVGPNDLLVLHFSGHGLLRNGSTLLIPSDGNMHSLDVTGIRLSHVQELVESCKARQKVFFLDACHSGAGRDIMPMTKTTVSELDSAEGIYTIASCKEDQISHEFQEQGQGVFTWALIEAIKNIEPDSEERVTLEALFRECRCSIINWCKPRCLVQTPVKISKTTDDIVLFHRKKTQHIPTQIPKRNLEKVCETKSKAKPIKWWGEIENKEVECLTPKGVQTKKIEYFRVKSLGLSFVYVKKNKYIMGSPEDELGRHEDEVRQEIELESDFLVLATPVTNAMYHEFAPDHNSGKYKKFDFNRADNPVVDITFDDALAYCRWLSEKLGVRVNIPHEIQWEYFCRAGTTQTHYFGNKIDKEFCLCLFNKWGLLSFQNSKSSVIGTCPVKRYKPNPWGVYSTLGNVWEWCRNCYAKNATKKPLEKSQRVAKGGSWAAEPSFCRAASRVKYPTGYSNKELGFRVIIEQ